MTKKIYGFQKIIELGVPKAEAKPKVQYDDGRDRTILAALKPFARDKPQSNLTAVEINYVSRKTSIAFILLPEWAHYFPPYNIARLAAVTKSAGYLTHAFDLNAKAHRDHVNWEGLDFNPWDGTRDWKWMKGTYFEELHQYMEPFLLGFVDKLVELNPSVLAFSLYYCNEEPVKWMVKELKKRLPNVKVLIGGPQCHGSYWQPESEYDYIVTGEGEQLLLDVLDQIENGTAATGQVWLKQSEGQRLDLDSLPAPDYSYFDKADYGIPNGVNFELSRGCTAKCTFCSETHFWKYRGRLARNILDEVSTLYYEHGVDVLWFLDSLVNGNLKELRAFCKGVIASGMKLHWTGYARCDERMDLEYYQDLADSGCISLSYGIESGSNKVLLDMDKGITVAEIEQNLQYGRITGVEAFSTWIIGFPTEEPQDAYDTICLIWRNRNNNLTHVSGGSGFNIPPDTIVAQNMPKYGVSKAIFENNWIREDFTNSKMHRLIRMKTFNIVLNNLIHDNDVSLRDRLGIESHYKLTVESAEPLEIEYEVFDFNICKPELNPLADSLVNEIWPLLRLLWRSRGAFSIQLQFSPELDLAEFGDRMGSNFWANILFDIDQNGVWNANFDFKYVQSENAWGYVDFSRADSVAAGRARKLALTLEQQSVVSNFDDDYQKSLVFLAEKKTHDFSFEYVFDQTGNWQ